MELDTFFVEQNRQGRFSGSVLVNKNGRAVFDNAYGMADSETERPNTPQTAYQIASGSKQFTAAAILLLQEQSKLSVQDHIQAWIPQCPAAWEPITIHHLLTHTSGIGHWRDFPELDLYAPNTREHLLQVFAGQPLKFAPGESWLYSSPAFVLLAHIVEQASGELYAAFLQRRLLQPLGLADTGAGNRAPHPEHQARGYEGEKPLPLFDLDTVGVGAGDLWSTTHDLARWDAALLTPGLLLSEASLHAMFTPHATIPDNFAGISGASYGYGWCLAEIEGVQVRFHPGDNSGFNSLNALLPDYRTSIILLSNNENSDLESIGLHLLGQLMS